MQMQTYIIQADGKAIAVLSTPTDESRRAANVYPTGSAWRAIFSVLRWFGLVEASRNLPANDWTADLTPSGGPVMSGFIDRLAAIEFEVFWLLENWDCGDDD